MCALTWFVRWLISEKDLLHWLNWYGFSPGVSVYELQVFSYQRLTTLFTSIWFPSRMSSNVCTQTTLLAKWLTTLLTRIRFISCVSSNITNQILKNSKWIIPNELTHFTLIRHFYIVNLLMHRHSQFNSTSPMLKPSLIEAYSHCLHWYGSSRVRHDVIFQINTTYLRRPARLWSYFLPMCIYCQANLSNE